MFLTKESDYGLRIIRALAGGEKKTGKAICGEEHIPEQYAYKILRKLESAGFVRSIRGRDGGYHLIRPLHTITLHDIVSAVDGNLFLFECLHGNSICMRNTPEEPCYIHQEFKHIQNKIIDEMRRKTMDEIL